MLMHLAVARETARGLGGKKAHGTGLLQHTFAFYKDINTTGAQWRKRKGKITLAARRSLFWWWWWTPIGRGGPGKRDKLCTLWLLNYINGTLLTDCAARKTDINIFEEDTRRANGDMTASLVSVLYQCFTKPVPLVLHEGLSVFLLEIWQLTARVGKKLSVDELYLIKCTAYGSHH